MNGYQIQADAYRTILERDRSKMSEDTIKNMEGSIRVFELLASFKDGDKYAAFDSSMFNDIFKGYIQLIIDELCEDEDESVQDAAKQLKTRIQGKAYSVLDRITAKEAEAYYMEH